MTPRAVASAREPKIALGLLPLDLQRWDSSVPGDLLAVYIWSDVRPLRGAAGLVDWRLCGRLSSLIQAGRLTGAEGEQLLLPTDGRLAWKGTIIIGLGTRSGFSTGRFRAGVRRALATAEGLGVHDLALALPGRDVDTLNVGRAIELLLAELRATSSAVPGLARLTVVEAASTQKEAQMALPGPEVGRAQK